MTHKVQMFAAKSDNPSSIRRMGTVESSDLLVCSVVYTPTHTFIGAREGGLRG